MSGKARPSLRRKTLENVKCSLSLSKTDKECIQAVFELADLQKAEIEKLTKDSNRLKKVEMQLDDMCKMYHIIKTEAVKEFAERLKTKASDFEFGEAVWVVYIDNLVKEMVGDNDASKT